MSRRDSGSVLTTPQSTVRQRPFIAMNELRRWATSKLTSGGWATLLVVSLVVLQAQLGSVRGDSIRFFRLREKVSRALDQAPAAQVDPTAFRAQAVQKAAQQYNFCVWAAIAFPGRDDLSHPYRGRPPVWTTIGTNYGALTTIDATSNEILPEDESMHVGGSFVNHQEINGAPPPWLVAVFYLPMYSPPEATSIASALWKQLNRAANYCDPGGSRQRWPLDLTIFAECISSKQAEDRYQTRHGERRIHHLGIVVAPRGASLCDPHGRIVEVKYQLFWRKDASMELQSYPVVPTLTIVSAVDFSR